MGASLTVVVGVASACLILAFRAFLRREPDRVIRRVIVVGLGAKLAGTFAYYRVIADVYGFGDVTRYVNRGRELAPIIRSGTLPEEATISGTAFTEFLAGLVFAMFGTNEIVGYLVFSTVSFVGMVAFLKAFQIAAPEANHRRYAFLILFLPTMVYWPSTIGKDAWLVFTLGVASYGAARILRGDGHAGYLLIALSLTGAAAVRPHMALLFMASFAVAYLIGLINSEVRPGVMTWIIGLAVVAGGLALAATNFSEEMGSGPDGERLTIDRLQADTEEVFDATARNTQLGGSAFESRPVRNVADFGYTVATLPFRPFPHEAVNGQMLLASLEGAGLLLLVLLSLPRLIRLPRATLRCPYFALSTAFSVGFLIAFSNFANLGLLTRQRSQLMPFLLVLLLVPLAHERKRARVGEPVSRVFHSSSARVVSFVGSSQPSEQPEGPGPNVDETRSKPGKPEGGAKAEAGHNGTIRYRTNRNAASPGDGEEGPA